MHSSLDNSQRQIPFKRALAWICLSVVIVTGSAALALIYYKHVRSLYVDDDAYKIIAIIQSTTHQEFLKSAYLAELLGLSIDRPTNLYRFNAKEAQRKLVNFPLIKEAVVKKIRPGTVFIDYALRQPAAFLIDYSNTAIDHEGYAFPFKPFFTPKKLPEIYLGLAQSFPLSPISGGDWGTKLQGERVALAFSILQDLREMFGFDLSNITRIDVSKAYAVSAGQRQIVVILEDRIIREVKGAFIRYLFPRILRLNVNNYRQGLSNFLNLRSQLLNQEIPVPSEQPPLTTKLAATYIDLRLSQLAILKYAMDGN